MSNDKKKGVERLNTESIDAQHWAECFCEQTGYEDCEYLHSWFANYWAAVNDPLQREIENLKASTVYPPELVEGLMEAVKALQEARGNE